MRILLISHTCQSQTEGQARAERLAGYADIHLKVLVPDRWFRYGAWRTAERSRGGVKYDYEIGKVFWPRVGPAQSYLHWYPGLAKILRKFKPDIIDLWEEPWSLASAHACWLRKRICPRAKLIVETEQNIHKTLPFPFEAFRSYVLKKVDFAIGRNAESLKILAAKGYAGPSEVIPNGVDTSIFRPLDREACQKKFGISGFTVCYVGRFVEEKGLEDIVNALPKCSEEVNAIFVGLGPLRNRLERIAKNAGKTDRIRFFLNVRTEDLAALLNATDALVLVSRTTASWKEQFGRVIAEAGACGVAVIGSNSGAIPEVVGEAGLIVPEGDPSALAAAIGRLAQDPGLRARLGALGRKQAEDKYAWEQIASRFRVVYHRMLAS